MSDNRNNLNTTLSETGESQFARSIFYAIAVMLGGKCILMVLGLITKIIMARSLGPENLGVFGLLVYACGLASVFANMGTQNAHVYNLGRDSSSVGSAFGFSLVYAATIGFLASIIFYFIYQYWLWDLYFAKYVKEQYLFVICIVLFIPANLLRLHLTTIFLGLKKFRTYNVFLFAESFLLLIFFIILISAISRLSAAVAAWIGSVLTVALLLLLYMASVAGSAIRFVISDVRCTVLFGFKAFLSGLAQAMITRIDLFFIGYFLNAKELGLYFLASSLTETVDGMVVPLGQVIFSYISGLDFRLAVSRVNTAFRIFLVSSVAAFTAFIPMVFYGIPLIFGSNYKSSAILVVILFPSIIARILIRTIFAFFMSQNIHQNAVIAYIGAVISLAMADIILIPRIGIIGAAFGLSVAYCIGLLIIICQYMSFTKISNTALWMITLSDFRRFREVLANVRSHS